MVTFVNVGEYYYKRFLVENYGVIERKLNTNIQNKSNHSESIISIHGKDIYKILIIKRTVTKPEGPLN